jgi:phosphate transport system permease protein
VDAASTSLLDQDEFLVEERPPQWSDRRVELMLGALVCAVVALLIAMIVFVFLRGWPSFSHNGLSWFSADGSVDQQLGQFSVSGETSGPLDYTFHAWPLLWSTILITGFAIVTAFITSLFVSVFIVEFAPPRMRDILQPIIRLLASVPSVIYGLIGVLVLVPFLGNHVISESTKESVTPAIQVSGSGLIAASVVLTVMIAPLTISIFCDGLRSVRRTWIEGSLACGVNRWRTFWKIGVHAARPAMVAGIVIATARALGEAVMLAMISGSVGFAPNPFDGLVFLVEPSTPLAATIIRNTDSLATPNGKATLFAIASVLLFSAALLSLAGWAAKRSMRKYGGGAEA